MKKLILLLLLPLTLCCCAQNSGNEDLHKLFIEYFDRLIETNPEIASQLRLSNNPRFRYFEEDLTDTSSEVLDFEYDLYIEFHNRIKKIDTDVLSKTDRINAKIFTSYLENILAGEKFRFHSYIINPMFGFHSNITNLMTQYHQLESIRDANSYIKRLNNIPERFDQVSEHLTTQINSGIIPPEYIIDYFMSVLDEFIAFEVKENPFYTTFRDRLANIEEIDPEDREALLQEVEAALNNSVFPAYHKLIDQIAEVRDTSDRKAGVWKLPKGKRYYEYLLKKHTTTDMKPQEIYNLGLEEIARIQAEIILLYKELGIENDLSFQLQCQQYWELTGSEPDLRYSNDEQGREQVIDDYLNMIKETEKRLPELFDQLPSIPVTVRRVPSYKESTSGQYYERAPLDGSSPAAFYTNLSWLPFKPGMQTLLYHETIPGHHLQIAIAQELTDQFMFHNLTFFTGFIEGWALYAEKLAYENGWFDNIYSQIGYLNSELFRAVRLVLDTGIHYKRWSRQEAYDYMLQNLGWTSYGELNRYIVWPGQACAYKVGQLKIHQLREKVKKELGQEFNIREFHRIVLEHGAIPLNLLEEIVEEYIIEKKDK